MTQEQLLDAVRESNRQLVAEIKTLRAGLDEVKATCSRLAERMPPLLFSVTEAARILSRNPRTISRMVTRGDLPTAFVGGRKLVDLSNIKGVKINELVDKILER